MKLFIASFAQFKKKNKANGKTPFFQIFTSNETAISTAPFNMGSHNGVRTSETLRSPKKRRRETCEMLEEVPPSPPP
ncbi:hypothetical protein POVWA1_032280 [Plasmodium ovale wallikeri]|uniref:Uncharacterized protein n=1 Tax=Plasmodium ovale wallikeri TaxID=864142 RepID=A0A1A8YXT9_PLAOA|nr:hypothetical protein POVWA1_032280 [Plasmodium ovale wallikeri]